MSERASIRLEPLEIDATAHGSQGNAIPGYTATLLTEQLPLL